MTTGTGRGDVFAFRRYEDSSLSYTGIESHQGLRRYGLLLTVASGEDGGVMFGGDVEWCVEGPAGGFGGALLFRVSWWWSGCRQSVVTSVMAARVEDSSTMALPAA